MGKVSLCYSTVLAGAVVRRCNEQTHIKDLAILGNAVARICGKEEQLRGSVAGSSAPIVGAVGPPPIGDSPGSTGETPMMDESDETAALDHRPEDLVGNLHSSANDDCSSLRDLRVLTFDRIVAALGGRIATLGDPQSMSMLLMAFARNAHSSSVESRASVERQRLNGIHATSDVEEGIPHRTVLEALLQQAAISLRGFRGTDLVFLTQAVRTLMDLNRRAVMIREDGEERVLRDEGGESSPGGEPSGGGMGVSIPDALFRRAEQQLFRQLFSLSAAECVKVVEAVFEGDTTLRPLLRGEQEPCSPVPLGAQTIPYSSRLISRLLEEIAYRSRDFRPRSCVRVISCVEPLLRFCSDAAVAHQQVEPRTPGPAAVECVRSLLWQLFDDPRSADAAARLSPAQVAKLADIVGRNEARWYAALHRFHQASITEVDLHEDGGSRASRGSWRTSGVEHYAELDRHYALLPIGREAVLAQTKGLALARQHPPSELAACLAALARAGIRVGARGVVGLVRKPKWKSFEELVCVAEALVCMGHGSTLRESGLLDRLARELGGGSSQAGTQEAFPVREITGPSPAEGEVENRSLDVRETGSSAKAEVVSPNAVPDLSPVLVRRAETCFAILALTGGVSVQDLRPLAESVRLRQLHCSVGDSSRERGDRFWQSLVGLLEESGAASPLSVARVAKNKTSDDSLSSPQPHGLGDEDDVLTEDPYRSVAVRIFDAPRRPTEEPITSSSTSEPAELTSASTWSSTSSAAPSSFASSVVLLLAKLMPDVRLQNNAPFSFLALDLVALDAHLRNHGELIQERDVGNDVGKNAAGEGERPEPHSRLPHPSSHVAVHLLSETDLVGPLPEIRFPILVSGEDGAAPSEEALVCRRRPVHPRKRAELELARRAGWSSIVLREKEWLAATNPRRYLFGKLAGMQEASND